MLNSTAADYVWLVPAIGFGLMWGGSQVLGSILAGSRTAETVAGGKWEDSSRVGLVPIWRKARPIDTNSVGPSSAR